MTNGPSDSTSPGAGLGQEVFGPYLVYERLGVGGMATVHRAREHGIEGFERIVALKRLLPHLAEDASFVKSFVREAKLASMLRHANIVQLYELGRVNTTYFISMEYIEGRDIRRILRQGRKVTGPPTINVTLALLLQLCDALDYAHTRCDDDTGQPLKLVHRDVSPSNLLVTKFGHLKVIDFGIAKAQSQQLRTATGRVKGKLAYMAPEAIAGKELDARSDIFSAGVIAHELLTARPLFASKNEYQTLLKVQKGDILPPSTFNQAVPPELDAVVLKALAREADNRWSSASEMRDALHEIRARYQVSASNREVASWCEWAFSMEAPGNNFSGPMVTDSLAGVSQSRSPLALPLPAGEPSQPAIRARPGSHREGGPREDDDAAEVAWGGAQEHDSGMPVVLEDVPDHSGRMPMAVAIAAAAEPPRSRPATAPPTFPHGSSDDAVPATARRKRSSLRPAVAEPNPDTERNPLVEASSFGAGMLERGAAESHTARKLIVVGVLLAAAAAALLLAMGGGSKPKTDPAAAAAAAPAETRKGKLKFIVEPPDAVIRIAGMAPHTGTDWMVDVDPGSFQVEISRDGHRSWITSIELSAGETQTVRVVLEQGGNPSVATLVITSTPPGKTVLLDGHEIGRTPHTQEIPPGPHSVALRENGEVKWKERFEATANSKVEFNADLSEIKQREREERERLSVVPERRTGSPRGITVPEPRSAPAPAPAPAPAKVEPEPVKVEPPKPEPTKVEPVVPAPTEKKDVKVPPPPPARTTAPVTIPPNQVKRTSGELGRIKAVVRDDETLPSTIAAKICIDTSGKPTSVKVMTKASSDLSSRMEKELRSFRYSPYKQDGVAVAACFAETFRIK